MWECGDCGQPETRRCKLDGVCHHCGVLLCPECRVVILDASFAGPLIDPERTAVHCRACRRKHHIAAVPIAAGVT